MSVAIARNLGMEEDLVEGLFVAASLHDVGKSGVPAEILSKPDQITSTEMGLIRDHVRLTHDIHSAIDWPWPRPGYPVHQQRLVQ
ncbi:MAG: hypothetical protein ISS61_09180 [Desulfobacteraceae bacterium]|nr:hypothetical protein [Desulfobacteraceae bacterium]